MLGRLGIYLVNKVQVIDAVFGLRLFIIKALCCKGRRCGIRVWTRDHKTRPHPVGNGKVYVSKL